LNSFAQFAPFIGFLFLFVHFKCWYGAVQGLVQTKIKRFIAYTIIFNNAFFLPLTIIGGHFGYLALLISLIFYTFTSLLTILPILATKIRYGYDITSLRELILFKHSNPYLGIIIFVAFFSALGMPPFLGFFMKFFVFLALLEKGQLFLTIFLILLSAFSAYYYLRITVLFLFQSKSHSSFFLPLNSITALLLSVFFILLLTIIFNPYGLINWFFI